ncbi:response regulator transcription factor [Limnohabitans sp.]|uniref:response regulator transcription factor n=1 Tax=Limnohabitans sp. TaxID=1907725 RepID=UPI00286EDC72|nr:response regulator transcription factor [Limnohabitans sp.]
MAISVVIIEDDPIVSNYLSALIRNSPLCNLVGAACNNEQAQKLIAEDADVYLVDIGLPDVSGIDLMRQIKGKCVNASVMVLTSLADMRHVMQSIEAGASGYLLKDDQPEELIEKLVSLYNGNSPLSPSVAKLLIKKITETPQQQPVGPNYEMVEKLGLSRREYEVLIELRSPMPVKLIAEKLNISYFTVNQHVRRIYQKLKVGTRSGALSKATEHGLF